MDAIRRAEAQYEQIVREEMAAQSASAMASAVRIEAAQQAVVDAKREASI